jgi:predicted PurR-regulated permease PerM
MREGASATVGNRGARSVQPDNLPGKLISYALSFGVVALTVYFLVVGRDLLIPIAIAIMVWYLLNALARTIGRIKPGGRALPRWACLTLAALGFVAVIAVLMELVSGNIGNVASSAPTYQANLERLIARVSDVVGLEKSPDIAQLIEEIDFASLIPEIAGALTGLAGNTGIILVYVFFLLIEQRSFDSKMAALFPDAERQAKVRTVLERISAEIQTYVSIKTLMSLLTGGLSYVVLIGVGVDYAEFWVIIIFLLNYIPTIGSLLGSVFPALLALVQFDTVVPFLIVLAALSVIQMSIGNLLEPRLMGRSLNLSPLVIILSLAVWGSIWGITGMFLCVPITVIAMIVLSHFPRTRPIAILLSSDGRIK